MPRSNNPYDLINALEDKYTELSSEAVEFSTDINAADEIEEEEYVVDDEGVNYSDAQSAFEYQAPEVQDIVNKIVKYNVATIDEIDLVASVLGLGRDWTVEMLNNIISARTGYDDIEGYIGEVYPYEN